MKYKDMNKEQQEAFRGFFLNIINIKSQEENQYTQQAYRILILGNGAGIVLLATFIGAVADKEIQVSVFVLPLIMFFIGVILAALVLLPLMSVANNIMPLKIKTAE